MLTLPYQGQQWVIHLASKSNIEIMHKFNVCINLHTINFFNVIEHKPTPTYLTN